MFPGYMANTISTKWIYAIAAIYIAGSAIGIYHEVYYVLLIPGLLAILWAAVYKLEYLFFAVVLFTPFSLNLEALEMGGIGMYVPTEPLLFGILIVFILKLLSGKSIDKKIFRHPISYLLYAYLTWMALTCVTSELPVVSIKYLITRIWFIASFYFIAIHLFSEKKNIRSYFLFYLFPLLIVIIYTVTRHAQYGFDKDSAHWVMEPLFKDHTSYGAVLAMYFPIIIGLMLQKYTNTLLRVLLGIGFFILTVGLILSFTRAAWISVLGVAGLLAIMLMRVKLQTLIIGGIAIGSFLVLGWDDIQVSLQQNKQESSDKLDEHVSSISNVSSDASNLERLNRWNCAIELFKERPIVGWGPGTYQFVYAPYQRSKDRTIISTNQGDGGNAHSEYLGPLCEQGFPGTILFVLLLYAVSHLAFKLFYSIRKKEIKILIGSAYLGLMTYFIHGVLNNYLDTDKASVPFWGFIAVLVAVDLYHKDQDHAEKKEVNPQGS
jgi:putative inorganic carbon (hco3(-)) transporter